MRTKRTFPDLLDDDVDLYELSLAELVQIKVSIGTRKSGRRQSRSPTPVDIIYKEQIEKSGFDNLTQILERHIPYFYQPKLSLADGAEHIHPFVLRGMQAEQILVLINGKRYHTSASLNLFSTEEGSTTDINTIPVAAIERIEFLRDGASAQYGSDAIAGVINIILKKTPQTRLSAVAGFADAADGDTRRIAIEHGIKIGDKGVLQMTAEYREFTGVNLQGPDSRQRYFADDPRNDLPNSVVGYFGDAIYEDFALALNSELSLDQGTLYNSATYNDRDSRTYGLPRVPQDNRVVRGLYPDGFTPTFETDIKDATWTIGLRTEAGAGNWKIDISNTLGYNEFDITIANSNNATLGLDSPTAV